MPKGRYIGVNRREKSKIGRKLCVDWLRSSLKISEQFANGLDVFLEPALEDRFSSTEEALERLNSDQSKLDNYSLSVLGSDVRLDKNSDRLEVNIPPYGLKIDAAINTCVITAIVNIVLYLIMFNEEIVLSTEFLIALHCCVSICILGCTHINMFCHS
ncbi:MAG: hypothetical protein AAFO95_14955, partial [Cyanobacteria bacterium J06600_6]